MHGNADTNITKLRPKIHMSRDYLVNRLCLQKMNLKRPLSNKPESLRNDKKIIMTYLY